MSSTSKKHKAFVSEPIADKPVKELPGIGKALGGRLEEKGYSKTSEVLGEFLVAKKDPGAFGAWLKDTCGANTKQQDDCYKGLSEWSDANL